MHAQHPEYFFYEEASPTLRKAIALYELEQPAWVGSADVAAQILPHVERVRQKYKTHDPEIAIFVEHIADKLQQTFEEVLAYRDKHTPARSANPLTDLRNDSTATHQLFEDLGLLEFYKQHDKQFRICNDFPLSFMIDFSGDKQQL